MLNKLKNFYGAHPIRRTLVTIVLAAAILALAYFMPAFALKAAPIPAAKITDTVKGEAIPVGGRITVAQKDGRTLTLDTEELVFTLKDDASGKTWTSALASAKDGKEKALLQVSYLGEDNNILEWNTYDNCVAFGSYELFAIENGVRIELDVNEGESMEFFEYLPQRLPIERYEEFLVPTLNAKKEDGSIDESTFKKYERVMKMMYKKNVSENCYVLTTAGAPSISATAQLIDMTRDVGYTRDMLIEDCAVYGVTPTFHEPAQFDIVLEARLDGGDLVVRLPGDEMATGNDFYQLYRLAVLPNFGAEAYSKEGDGYILTPDGAGALMRFNTYAGTVPEYVRSFMDNDYYSDYYYMSEYGEELMTPVYGILYGGENPTHGLMGIIEQGVETANLHVSLASVAGSGANKAYVSYDVLEFARVKIYGAYSDNAATYLSTSGHIPADYTLRYRPYGTGVTYFDLAMDYRDYLSARTGREITSPAGPGTYLEVMGALTLTDRFLGVPYNSITSMTTYEELTAILADLPDEGVTIQYDGGFNGGYLSGLNDGARLVKENGDEAALQALNSAVANKNIDLLWQVNLSRVYENGRSYIPYLHALRDFSNSAAEIYSYSAATGIFNGRWDPIQPYTRVSPRYLPYLAEKLMADLPENTSLALGDLARDVYADYRYRDVVDPVESRALVRQALAAMNTTLALHDPATDLAPLGKYAVNVSRRSSEYATTYATVPFRQLALSGLTQVVGEDVNLSSRSLDEYLLQAAELGTSVKYTITAKNPDILKSSHFEYLYAVHYEDWKDEVARAIGATAALRQDIGGKAIVNHRLLAVDVFETTYEGGLKVVTNYSSAAYEGEAGVVEAGSYQIIKEGGSL